MKVTHAPALLLREWADLAHLIFLDEMGKGMPWRADQLVFHGGTNLHLSWGSPRASEDLDFLLTRSAAPELDDVMQQIKGRLEERIRQAREEDGLSVELRCKTKDAGDRMHHYQFVISSPYYLGVSRIKTEFWSVTDQYLAGIDRSSLKLPYQESLSAQIESDLSVATLKSAFADKISALVLRRAVKWRDIFDLWWIGARTHPHVLQDVGRDALHSWDEEAFRVAHHVKAYNMGEGITLCQALDAFSSHDRSALLQSANNDLRRWIPDLLWKALYPDKLEEMIFFSQSACAGVSAVLRESEQTHREPHDEMQQFGVDRSSSGFRPG